MTSNPPKPDPKEDESSAAALEQKAGDPVLKPAEAPGEREVFPAPLEGASAGQMKALMHYLMQTDVHTYAFSVAANVILSLFPFIVMLMTISRNVFHSSAMASVVGEMMKTFLPSDQNYIIRNMSVLANPHKGVQFFSVFMLLFSSTGVFLPLEVALNNVWHVQKNRSYLNNQIVSLGLAFAVGALALASVAFSTGQQTVLNYVFFGHTENWFYQVITASFLKVLAVIAGILLFFLIYWILPNRKVPPMAVLPTAVVVGLLWEIAKQLYIHVLPWLDFRNVYGPFAISVGLMMWAFISGLLLLAGAHFSATRHALREARAAEQSE